MKACCFKISLLVKSVVLISGVLAFSGVNAQTGSGKQDGGVMKQMMAAQYHPNVITDPAVQARLSKVLIAEPGHQNGGAMKQMMAEFQ